MKIFACIICLLLSFSSLCQKKHLGDFKAMISEKKNIDDQLCFNGVYDKFHLSRRSESETNRQNYFSEPVIFFKNGLLTIGNIFPCNYLQFKEMITHPKTLTRKSRTVYWGTYEINGDEINALVFIGYESGFPRFRDHSIIRFHGTITDKNKIINWRPIPPYTKAISKFHEIDTTRATLLFHHYEAKNLIDSSKAWVNKYRK